VSHYLSHPLKFNCSLFRLLLTMNNDARTVRSYRKNSAIQVPATPDYLSPFLSQSTLSSTSPAVNSLVASSPDGLWASTSTNSLAASGSPFNVLGSSSQPRLIQPRKNEKAKLEAKFKRMEEFLGNSGFDSIGDFLEILFYNPTRVDGIQFVTLQLTLSGKIWIFTFAGSTHQNYTTYLLEVYDRR
jgi:hypothetical protein